MVTWYGNDLTLTISGFPVYVNAKQNWADKPSEIT